MWMRRRGGRPCGTWTTWSRSPPAIARRMRLPALNSQPTGSSAKVISTGVPCGRIAASDRANVRHGHVVLWCVGARRGLAMQRAQHAFRDVAAASVGLDLLQVDMDGGVRLVGLEPQRDERMAGQAARLAQGRGGVDEQGLVAPVPVGIVVPRVDGGDALVAREVAGAEGERRGIVVARRGLRARRRGCAAAPDRAIAPSPRAATSRRRASAPRAWRSSGRALPLEAGRQPHQIVVEEAQDLAEQRKLGLGPRAPRRAVDARAVVPRARAADVAWRWAA